MTEKEIIPLGALLHDIGKFRQRADREPHKYDHSQWGQTWLETIEELPKEVAVCAEWHHRDKHEANIITSNLTLITDMADNYASGSERMEKERASFAPVEACLRSTLAEIALDKENVTAPVYFALSELSDQLVFPQKKATNTQEKYAQLWAAFEKEFRDWAKAGCFIDSLLPLLERYLSFIPSETLIDTKNPKNDPDISLYDHLKSSAAIASCLYAAIEERKQGGMNQNAWVNEIRDQKAAYFKLIGGDLSGVQKFIYTISSKGALKTLRARSFFLELFAEHVISQLLQATGLCRANLIYSGGARFYLLAPNTKPVNEALLKVRKTANDWLWHRFRGQLALIVESIDFTGEMLMTKQAAKLWGDLAKLLNEAKRRKLSDHLEELLTPLEPTVAQACDACHRDDIPVSEKGDEEGFERLCSFCKDMLELGGQLAAKRCINTVSRRSSQYAIEIFDAVNNRPLYLEFADKPANEGLPVYWMRGELSQLYQLQRPVMLSAGVYVRLNKHLEFEPKGEEAGNSPATLQSLAQQACGKPLIGALRMDVDNLGLVFFKGLPEDKRTFTRMAMLSRQLSLFFRKYLSAILAGRVPADFPLTDFSGKNPRQNGRNVHVIYAGGDDLFLIGAWDDAAESAIDIQRAFARFGGNNPSLTISGGFVVQKHNFPLYRLAEITHEAEQHAKNSGRNRMTMFFDPEMKELEHFTAILPWGKVEDCLINPLKLFIKPDQIRVESGRRYHQHGIITSGHINRLYQLMLKYTRDGLLYLPALAYMIGRIKNFQNKYPDLVNLLVQPHALPDYRNAVLWLNLASRKGGN